MKPQTVAEFFEKSTAAKANAPAPTKYTRSQRLKLNDRWAAAVRSEIDAGHSPVISSHRARAKHPELFREFMAAHNPGKEQLLDDKFDK